MSTERQAERAAIQAAAQRLLQGTPVRSTGALTVLQLAAEAGVKRWVLTHKHPDLKQDFEHKRRHVNGIPDAYQALHGKVHDLEAANQRLRADNSELQQRLDVYAQVIFELSQEIHRLQASVPLPANVRVLRQRHTPPA